MAPVAYLHVAYSSLFDWRFAEFVGWCQKMGKSSKLIQNHYPAMGSAGYIEITFIVNGNIGRVKIVCTFKTVKKNIFFPP